MLHIVGRVRRWAKRSSCQDVELAVRRAMCQARVDERYRPSVLFLCTGNSCRSQMAEAIAKAKLGKHANMYSAGIEAHGINPLAAKATFEIGLDITQQKSQTLQDLDDIEFDLVVTVCSHAHDKCPVFQGSAQVVHREFPDPPTITKGLPEDESMPVYRSVRDEIASFVSKDLPAIIDNIVEVKQTTN